ncbi:hypothetical protein ABK040_002353 [Willaertia magna]
MSRLDDIDFYLEDDSENYDENFNEKLLSLVKYRITKKDYIHHQITPFSYDFAFVTSFGDRKQNKKENLNAPFDIKIHDHLQLIFISDYENQKIKVFNLAGKYKYDINTINKPRGIAIDFTNDTLVGVDDANVISRYSITGKILEKHSNLGLYNPKGIFVYPTNQQLYVTDTENHKVKVFDKNCKLLFTFGKHGSQDGEFIFPSRLEMTSNGNLAISDLYNYRIQLFDPCGKFLSSFGGTDVFSLPSGICVDKRNDNYIVSDYGADTIRVFNKDGKKIKSFNGGNLYKFKKPNAICLDKYGHLYISEWEGGRIQILR